MSRVMSSLMRSSGTAIGPKVAWGNGWTLVWCMHWLDGLRARFADIGKGGAALKPYHPRAMDEQHANEPVAESTAPDVGGAFRRDVQRVLALIRPAVQDDGGDIELVSADPSGLVRIRLLGACIGCPSSSVTLHHGIERTLRAQLGPHLQVEAVA